MIRCVAKQICGCAHAVYQPTKQCIELIEKGALLDSPKASEASLSTRLFECVHA